MEARTKFGGVIALTLLLLIAAAVVLHAGRALADRYPAIAVIETLWKSPPSANP